MQQQAADEADGAGVGLGIGDRVVICVPEEEGRGQNLHGKDHEALLEGEALLDRRAAPGDEGTDGVVVDVGLEAELLVHSEVLLANGQLGARVLEEWKLVVVTGGSFIKARVARLVLLLSE